MKTKINISAEMREFNEAVEAADCLTDFRYDKQSAEALLAGLRKVEAVPTHADWLANAIAGIASITGKR